MSSRGQEVDRTMSPVKQRPTEQWEEKNNAEGIKAEWDIPGGKERSFAIRQRKFQFIRHVGYLGGRKDDGGSGCFKTIAF